MKLELKIKVLESTVIPVPTYGAQSWTTTDKQIRKLQSIHNSMLRNIIGIRIRDKVNLKEIFQKTKAKRVSWIAKLLKIRYAGHIIREPKQKCNNIMTT